MALIKCKECGKEISKSAKSCPHCGAPADKAKGGFNLAKFMVVLLGAVFIISLFNDEPTTNTRTPATTSTTPKPPPKKWDYYESQNPVDDTITNSFILSPDSGQNYKGTFDLVVRCKSNKTELYVKWHDYLGDDSSSVYEDWKNVIVRVGDSKAVTQRWSISTDKTATFASSAIPLLKKIANADKLLLQTTPYNENPAQAIYDTKGLEEPISKIAKRCNWKL
ncbi:zinc ribbon domain-containing protein [Alcanivorax sp. S6407]|uniref:type VI secretion system-associated protein TagO n=1 Tax=Alcanivorax sp. S6407 TaxID=2926424 RepID=UPI001FF42AF7|nr:type VI secretion system-associated protein TagO [Alcanivorax sp. S6407]MCK0153882.1 zinc ribbon domain-containing protein [Alcanivorax sp. S6407]